MSKRRILVTAALPYANGDIHIGHLLEYLQTDYWTRFQKMRGHECLYFCADDTHGAPIMLSAREKNISPEELIAEAFEKHTEDFRAFEIEFDFYGSTHTDENKKQAEYFFECMKSAGHIVSRNVSQSYCTKDQMFLPDRFVRGTCPKCGAENQYGDSCDKCSSTYSPTDLKNPRCAVCGTPPTVKESEHLFFQLENLSAFLKEWVPKHTDAAVANKLGEWLGSTLREWDISRDAPYFGFEIPGHPKKYFYVWLDAPIGYVSTTERWCKQKGYALKDYWSNPNTEIYHFIGKDIIYFHTLFWPAMLHCTEHNTPTQVFVHGFLMVNGEKMSKSKGTFVNASKMRQHVNPTYLRYYYASKLTSGIDDFDFSLDEFVTRINSELVGKITNIASRSCGLLAKNNANKLGKLDAEGAEIVKIGANLSEEVAKAYEGRNFGKGLELIKVYADRINQYVDSKEPWHMVKKDPASAVPVLTAALNGFRIIAIYLKPIMPSYVQKVEKLFGADPYIWASVSEHVEEKTLNVFEHLIQRLEAKQVDAVFELTSDRKAESK